jgi:hypothetical protein
MSNHIDSLNFVSITELPENENIFERPMWKLSAIDND